MPPTYRRPGLLAIAALTVALATPAPAQTVAEKAKLCASCHGRDGRPADAAVPIIQGQRVDYLIKQLEDYVAGRRDSQIMSSIAESLGSDLAAVAGLIAAAPWPQTSTTTSAEISAVSPVSACSTCHGGDFRGAVVQGEAAPRIRGQSAAYARQTMADMASGQRGNAGIMTAIAQSVDDEQIEAVAAYMAGLGEP